MTANASDPARKVTIVGAGPTGLMLAGELALAGVECTVVERRSQRSPESRALGLHARTLELLDMRGMAEEFLAAGLPLRSFPMGTRRADIDLGRTGSRFPYFLILPQGTTEELLENRARALGVHILRDTVVEDVEQDTDGVTLTIRDATGSRTERSAYVVGCDGKYSAVREALGVPFPGVPNTDSVLLADAYLDGPSEPRALSRFSRHGMLIIFPYGGGRYRIAAADHSAAGLSTDQPATLDDVRAVLIRFLGTDRGIRDPYWLTRYRSEQRQAERYRVGRVLLAGDAAHAHSPIGGQGLNTGLQDAMNLGWKLAAEINGWAPVGLLDSYHGERHPIGQQVVQGTRGLLRLSLARTTKDRLLRALVFSTVLPLPRVQRRLAKRLSGLAVRYPAQETNAHPLTGTRVPDVPLVGDDGGERRCAELLREGQPLLVVASDTPGLQARAQAYSPAVVRVAREGGPHGDWTWPRVSLVRPDGYLWWATDEPDTRARLTAVQNALTTHCSATEDTVKIPGRNG
ncbi:FAD-dependent monooxygenase [Streptomyces arenae]|uniref:FAD-dependent monooxygenase n=1 Tax=Streptomyces arenae TaxID=29301 RepID=UPI00265B2315|nr:FAD-dependent monooxygenase [Streptomyces arenae]MCG7210091.1 FAD-dependent monooxygenase [Streptomyces arenae]